MGCGLYTGAGYTPVITVTTQLRVLNITILQKKSIYLFQASCDLMGNTFLGEQLVRCPWYTVYLRYFKSIEILYKRTNFGKYLYNHILFV